MFAYFKLLHFTLDKGGGADPSATAEQKSTKTESDSPEGTEGSQDSSEATGAAADSPSKQLPDHISFFSGNPSVEIIHGIMHLYKTK